MTEGESGFGERELSGSRMREVAQELGFESTAELDGLEGDLAAWRNEAEALAEKAGPKWQAVQIGMLVEQARIVHENGDTEEAKRQLEDALDYASNMGFDDIAHKLIGLII